MLLGEHVLVDVVGQPHIEQAVLLFDEESLLPGEFGPLSAAVGLSVSGLRGQHHAEPVTNGFVLDLHLVEERQHLGFDVRFLHPDAGMVALGITGTAIVNVFVDPAVLSLLPDQLAGDGMAAVSAGHELTRVGQRRGMMRASAKQCLHPVPGRPVDQRLMLAGIPLTLVLDFTDVAPILEHRVDRGAGEPWLRRAIHPTLGVDLFDHAIERQVLVGVEMEHPLDVGRLLGIGLDDAPAVFADIAIAVGSRAAEPAFLHAAGDSFADIDGHLLGVEARHVSERPPHHATGRRVLGRLRDGDERQVVFRFQPFEFDVIEQVPRRPIHLVEQQAVEGEGVLLGIGKQLAERLPLFPFAGRLGDLEELDDLATGLGRITLEGILLHFQAEAFAFLFPAADAGQSGKLFHGVSPTSTGNKNLFPALF